jgi:hypothetical protein
MYIYRWVPAKEAKPTWGPSPWTKEAQKEVAKEEKEMHKCEESPSATPWMFTRYRGDPCPAKLFATGAAGIILAPRRSLSLARSLSLSVSCRHSRTLVHNEREREREREREMLRRSCRW